MKNKFAIMVLTLLLTMTVVLAGCSSKQEPKEALKAATANAATMTSYELKSKLVIEELQVTAPDLVDDASVGMVMSMLKNAELTVDGFYQADPMQTELTLGLNLKGDMAMSFNIPIIMTPEKMYVKIPSIPMMPLPETVIGKYLELDLKELAEQEGAEFNLNTLDTEKTQKLSSEISEVLFNEYDEASYFKDIAVKDANLPEGVEAKQVVQFYLTNDNIAEAITILVEKALPSMINIIDTDEYRELLGVKAEDIQVIRDELSALDKAEFNQGLEEMKSMLTINNFNMNTAIDKKDFTTYQDMALDFAVNDPETNQEMKLALKGYSQFLNINEAQTFVIGIPAAADILTMEQLEKEFGGLY
ncbi:hypothetical protein [Paenibacillus crassostreae]|uniref:Lipoprotein n=1 Tax=Paenibacillus crassostreae TaxID=1763538 RepID=A0A167D475_9BACL|nr:hypothetical protein [Paenibacillus crassostreae]AOZ92775.1 hypothetical protein LPB68_11525 [Paenibacillus crassostreae]OAB73912.1 hypothetical protein PNBC_13250 [Paenibacillus crassostreae]